MRIKPAIGTVVGNTDANHWGQVLMMPQAYGVIEVTDVDGIARGTGVRALGVMTNALSESVVSLADLAGVVDALRTPSVVTCI
ncbi:MAG: hypothetical protein AAB889_03125, partial [Patescibacteria group bacterium]